MIRVGRIEYKRGRKIKPSFPNFTEIEVMTPSTKYGSLSPYVLKDRKGRYIENLWQFSKVYKTIPKSRQVYSRYDPTVIWGHPAETHVDDQGELTPGYFAWRKKGFYNKYPVRYPVGFHHRHKCLYAWWKKQKLGYIESRMEIYIPEYIRSVKKEPQFKELKKRLEQGENLLIIEVDGPHQESLPYYQKNYDVEDDFIDDKTILATPENLTIMANDEKHPFGHGYCLAMALLGMELE